MLVVSSAGLQLASGRLGFYEDEGINLLKAFMVERGHPLYSAVFSDQAPVFTWLLSGLMALFGTDLWIYRQVAIVCGVALLGAVAAVTAEVGGRAAGTLCAALSLTFVPVLKFASTVVITTPAMALATWSLFLGLRYARAPGRRGLLVASGLLLGLAATCKLAAGYFVPVVASAVLWRSPERTCGQNRVRALGLWLVALGVPILLVTLLVPGTDAAPQVLQPHVAAYRRFEEQASLARGWMLLAPGMTLLYLATVLALAVALLRRVRGTFVLVVWLAVVVAWITRLRPLWAHHLPDLLLAMNACLATGTVAGIRGLRAMAAGSGRRGALVLQALPLSLLVPGLLFQVVRREHWRSWFENASEAALQEVAQVLARETGPDDWVIVDRPMVAFLARRPVPPSLVLISQKRVAAALTSRDLTMAIDRYQPAMLVLCTGLLNRFGDLRARLRAEYQTASRLPIQVGSARRSCVFYRRRA